jgi:hypothetical protein
VKAAGYFNPLEGFVLLDIPEGKSIDKSYMPTHEEMADVEYSVRPVLSRENGDDLARNYIRNS